MEDAAYASEYALLLCNSDENPDKERFYLDVMVAESVDGIVLPPFDETDSAVIDIVLARIGELIEHARGGGAKAPPLRRPRSRS